MWLSGVLLLICHYQMVSTSKTIMTNEISMPSLGHKEEVATFHRLQPKDGISPRFRSARFERLRGAPDNIKPIFVEPAVLETEESLNPTPVAPIQVVPSSETVTEIPLDFVPTSNETPTPLSFTEFNIESMPIIKDSDEPSTHKFHTTPEQPTTSEEPSTAEPSTFEPIPTTEQVSPSEIPSSPALSTEQTSEVSRATPVIHEYAQERIYPTMELVQPTTEFVEVLPSQQIEVASTNVVEIEEPTTTSTKAPRKRRHRRKHRKLRKVTKVTEAPTETTTVTEIITEPSTELSTTEPITEPSTAALTETSTLQTTTPVTTPVASTPISVVTTPTTTHIQTFPTSGSTGAKIGESYLGGWNEDEGIIVTTSGPSLGSAINQFSEIPASISIDDDKAIKEYYEKYYAEWYQKHNQAINTPGESASSVSREIKIELAKPTPSPFGSPTTQPFGISPSTTAEPTKEQLDKVCDYVAKISKSFGIKDLVGFAKNNCAFVKSFHPTATCEQIQHLMSYCVTGVYVNQ
ncbi:hypothetical protein CRE_00747 [Caenorhabditis remanei]|uniref:aECM cysteine-cradle domain-containing protein n=1 Tax=Caenorhabditis remanei TaxID=31234 RepID=E3LE42_CAERE|nr:hypothetical protein CRE_00747 [Caenorhabditis remanei]